MKRTIALCFGIPAMLLEATPAAAASAQEKPELLKQMVGEFQK